MITYAANNIYPKYLFGIDVTHLRTFFFPKKRPKRGLFMTKLLKKNTQLTNQDPVYS